MGKSTILVRDDQYARASEDIIVDEQTEIEKLAKQLTELNEKFDDKFEKIDNILGITTNHQRRMSKMVSMKRIISNQQKRMSKIHEINLDDDEIEAALEILDEISMDDIMDD